MDVWCFEDDSHHSSSSSGSLPQIPFSELLSSFSCIDDNYVAEIPPVERDDRVQFGDLELLNPSTMQLQGQLDELSMHRGSTDSTCETSLDILHEQPQTRRSLQSNLFYEEQSLLTSDESCSFYSLSSIYTKSDMHMLQISSVTGMNQHTYARFLLPMVEEMAITRAMVSVISSSSSSSLSSTSAASSYQHLSEQGAQTYQSQATYYPPKMCSFQPYSSSISRKLESHNNVHSQSMIKKAHNMLRSVNKLRAQAKEEETQLTAYQMQHMVLERRRRERLNSSFHLLGKLLPPGSKKDKTAVLCNTVSYMKTLKSEIYELEEKNRVLEEKVLPFEAELQSIDPNERVQVKLRKSSQTESEEQQIYLVIMVRVQCDLIRVVLQVLECIKTMKAISLLSLDAIPNHEQMKLFATMKLAIEINTLRQEETILIQDNVLTGRITHIEEQQSELLKLHRILGTTQAVVAPPAPADQAPPPAVPIPENHPKESFKEYLEVSTWDERTFTEAITGAAHMGLSLPA
ncbi:putative transcription factor bHLH041 [Platanthera guangdongensis]|uniref:Transcription factor bHLH041 n=1 Tax=Platanthera guangdongensis TaxID=2320717 RepID=A0ABR2MJ09_9ASPA